MIRLATSEDAQQVTEIYNHYVIQTTVTFEEEEVTADDMRGRMEDVLQKYPWLVFAQDKKILGYAYAGPWKSRCAYRHSAEISVYLREGYSGKGLGTDLFRKLLDRLSHLNLHGIIGGVALPNDGCVALHKKFGFEKVAHFKEVGHKFNQWIDVAYYEKIL
jgi:L-amino acid N-acyltransferase YncA